MEGGNKSKIPLDSGLDVKSSDQLVPVNQPLFQHNRQRFQGHTLPTSLRFEHNGFGAGWGVYEFEINYFTVDTTPARFTVMRQQLNANPTYIFRLRIGTTTYAMVYWNGEDVVKAGDLEITHSEDNKAIVTLKGDNDGHELELVIDMVSGEVSYNDAEWYLIETDYHAATANSGQTDISLLDLTSWVEFNAAVVFPEDVEYNERHIASYYSCVASDTGHIHTWSDPLIENGWVIEYNSDTNEAYVNGTLCVSSFDGTNGIVNITYNTEYQGQIEIDITGEVFYYQIYGLGISTTQKYITTSASGSYSFELWEATIEGSVTLWPSSNAGHAIVSGWVPYWVGVTFVKGQNEDATIGLIRDVQADSVSPNHQVFQGTLCFVTSSNVSFYSEPMSGSNNVRYWQGGKDLTDEYVKGGRGSSNSGTLTGSLTYCCCMFNRVRVKLDMQSYYVYGSLPISNGTGSSNSIEENSRTVSWWDGGVEEAYDGTESERKAGYYIPMEQNLDAFSDEKGGGWMFLDADFPDPDAWNGESFNEQKAQYVDWESYNESIEWAALYWRDNIYEKVDFFIAKSGGDYVNKNEQAEAGYAEVLSYLEIDFSEYEDYPERSIESCVYFTVEEWNDAVERYNGEHSSEQLNEITSGGYALNLVASEADSEYTKDSSIAWVISSDYVGEYQNDKYGDDCVLTGELTGQNDCMRLEEPYAYYDLSVESVERDGTLWSKPSSTSNSTAAIGSMSLVLMLENNPYTDPSVQNVFYFGDGFDDDPIGAVQYVKVDYRTTSSSTDNRNYSVVGSGSGSGSDSDDTDFNITLSGGFLDGLKIDGLYVGGVPSEGDQEAAPKTFAPANRTVEGCGKGSRKTASEYMVQWFAEETTNAIKDIYNDTTYINPKITSVEDNGSSSWEGDGGARTRYCVKGTVNFTTESLYIPSGYILTFSKGTDNYFIGYEYTKADGSTSQYAGGTLADGFVDADAVFNSEGIISSDITVQLGELLDMQPLAAYLYATGFGGRSSGEAAKVYLAVCFKGYFQSEFSSNNILGDDSVYTVDNFTQKISFNKSIDAELLQSNGLYIDRDTTDKSDHCIDLVCKSMEIGSTGAEFKMFLSAAFDESTNSYKSYWLHQSQGSGEVFIPGDIYYGSDREVKAGYNMEGLPLNYTYTTSAITFTIRADVVEFYKANSMNFSWPSALGTHDFYSNELPSARENMSVTGVTFGSPSNSQGGIASGQESLNINFNGTNLQTMVSFSQADDEGTTSIEFNNGEPLTVNFEGYDFTFSLRSYEWDSNNAEVLLNVSTPLIYPLSAKVPYQYSYQLSFEFDESRGKYLIDGAEYDNVPVGLVVKEYSPETLVYTFESDEGYRYYYNENTAIFTYGITEFTGENKGEAVAVTMEGYEYLEYSFILEGAYQTYKCTLVSFDDDDIVVDYDGTRYSFPYSELMTDEEPDEVNFMYTDTRDASAIPETKTFARQNFEDEYQFLRQTWETTTAVENYWWINSTTILELNKTSFLVKKKQEFEDFTEEATVDDWGGDFWETVAEFPRYDYINNLTPKYGMTSSYGDSIPRFWTMTAPSTSNIKITFYTLNETDYGNYTSYSFDSVSTSVSVRNISIGTRLNSTSTARINTYSQLSAETILYDSKFSSTVRGEHILFGIHNDNNYNQWALDILTTGELQQVVQGYGFVGVNGCLTGGEIPSAWFDPTLGFTGTVQPISVLEQEEDLDVTTSSAFINIDCGDIVVGDESQQWYITKRLTSIVSHLNWDEEAEMWGTEVLYLNNNVDQVYGSASFGANVVSEKAITSYNFFGQLEEAFGSSWGSAVLSILKTIGTVYMYYISPRLTTMLYLQQTMGQYAYVHYNTDTPGKQQDPARENTSENGYSDEGIRGRGYGAAGIVVDEIEPNLLDPVTPENQDDFSFNLHTIRQQVYIDNGWTGLGFSAVYVLLQGLLSLTDTVSSTLQVNKHKNEISASEFGKKFSQVFLRNMDKLSSIDTNTLGMMPVQNSAVTGVLTLDMFYSTSEGQKIQAGPGWVQHNLVAQCVAQSVTSNQMELKQIGIFIPLSELGTLVYRVSQLTLYYISEVLVITAQTLAAGSDQYGIMGTAASISAGVAATAKFAVELFIKITDVVDQLLRAFTGSTPLAKVLNTGSKHNYDMEGKHKYGQKSEVFMWPCWDIVKRNTYENESVAAVCENVPWSLSVPTGVDGQIGGGNPKTSGTVCGLDASTVTYKVGSEVTLNFSGDVPYMIANCRGVTEEVSCPEDMAAAIGTESFLPPVPFRNENIGVSTPTFPTPPIQDYIIDKEWELSMTATQGYVTWVSCKDTKLIDGEYSNIVITDEFCGVACPYTAIEIQRGYEQKYVRPWAITPNAIALNQTGLNAAYDEKAYHAFDGYGYRLVKWCGAAGMNKEGLAYHYAFIVNDRFKRSNKLAPNTYIGNFKGEPIISLRTLGEDKIFNDVLQPGRNKGLIAGAVGEDKDARRYATPVFAEYVSTLPAVVKTISAYNLSVIDGITSLTSDNRDLQTAYKAPVSIDFAIGKDKYRFTDEYICQLDVDPLSGVTIVKEIVPTLGLTYLGATPYEAYLYSQATRQYYTYSGGANLQVIDMLERFRDIVHGRYDFVNQEVVLPCLATFVRLDKHVFDDEDERDNTIVPRLKNGMFVGEVAPPIETIYNMRSGFKTISLPSGICFQGPNRCIINRFVYSDYMKEQILENAGQWERVPRERYHPFRKYEDEYKKVDENVLIQVNGWTHNPFLLVTSPLGVSSEVDCIFEWEVTFAWPVEMDDLYKEKQYAVVNLWAETFSPGGKVIPERPTHVFLYRDLFTRTGNYGYYSFRYQSKCGAGNRERLHIWSDQYIAVSGLQVEYKAITEKRTEVLTQQVDVQDMEEI